MEHTKNMENNNWEAKWLTSEIVNSLKYWEKKDSPTFEKQKVEIGEINETEVPVTLNNKKFKITISEYEDI
jgi:hypothetical protein